jgi:hypothetical protein
VADEKPTPGEVGRALGRRRRSNVGRLIAQARAAGASKVTTPDGFVIEFGSEPTEPTNPWLREIEGRQKQ